MPTKKKTPKLHAGWTITIRGALKKEIRATGFDLWEIKQEYVVKSVHVYPSLKNVTVYVVKL